MFFRQTSLHQNVKHLVGNGKKGLARLDHVAVSLGKESISNPLFALSARGHRIKPPRWTFY